MSKKKKIIQPAQKSSLSKPSQSDFGSATATAPSSYAKASADKEKLLLAGCLILTFAVFANTFGAGFVNWDDHGYLWLNPMVKTLGSMDLGQIFSGHTHGNYSPLVIVSYCFEHTFDTIVKPGQMAVENFQPFLYHFDNVLLHVGTTAMAFFFFRALGVRGLGVARGRAPRQSLRYMVTTAAPPRPRLCWSATRAPGTWRASAVPRSWCVSS